MSIDGYAPKSNDFVRKRKTSTALLKLSVVSFLGLILAAEFELCAQQNEPITLNVNAVSLLTTVRDKHGNIVSNLTKDDFVLDQDEKPQTITYFSKESDLPLTLGLLVDTSMSQRRVLGQEREASRSFLDHVLREDKDKAFVIQFAREVELLQELTGSRKKLQAAIDKLDSPEFSQSSGGGPRSGRSGGGGGAGGGYGGYGGHGSHGRGGGAGTLLYDAAFLASDELMKKPHGRKALIILTDGVDRGSKETLEEAIETAQRADTLVYCILFADKEAYRPHMGGMGSRGGGYPRRREEPPPDGKQILEQMSKATGGRFFEVTKKEPIDKIYAAIDEELRNQYSLGYTPDKSDSSVGYHRLQLTVKQKDMIVQTRDGFYLEH